ncbi:MAG: methyltransferase, FkbM family domain protein [Candidatus Adlerbacteria bacterium]|nr:methyltransferase, FkbM family domain protein [Candidatus Adlerbacteria bacterium]
MIRGLRRIGELFSKRKQLGLRFSELVYLYIDKHIPTVFGVLDYPRVQIRLMVNGAIDILRLSSVSKEPETVEWLEDRIKPGSVLYDIGANVGAYSLIAGALGKGRAHVFAIEPSFTNFYSLSRNVLRNNLQNCVQPLYIALSNTSGTQKLFFSHIDSGAAKHSIGTSAQGDSAQLYMQVPITTFDLMIESYGLPAPTLIKIDVDGFEYEVVKGAGKTLSLPDLKSVLIEIDLDSEHGKEIEQLILSHGFALTARHPRSRGQSNRIFNYIFDRVS